MNGSAIEGRAQPMKSSTPWRIIRTMTSGLVKRPTPTTGLAVNSRMPLTSASCAASSLKREGPEQSSQVPCARSQQVRQIAIHVDEFAHFGVGKAEIADGLVERDAQRQRHRVADRVAHVRDDLAGKARAVLEAAAVFVGALVGGAAEEMLEDAEAMRAVEADQIETRDTRSLGGVDEPAPQVSDVGLVHRAGLHRIVGEGADRQGGRRQRHLLGVEVRAVDAGIGELDAGQRAVRFIASAMRASAGMS